MITNKTMFALLSMIIGASLLVLSIPNADALNTPDVRVDWENHDATYGTTATIAKKDPSLTNPATDWWWAKSFTSWGVYSIWLDEGAVGAGTVKYNPIGGGATKYVGFVYYWDDDVATQGYSFGTTTISGTVTPSTKWISGSSWDRITLGYGDTKTISGLQWAHPKYAVVQSNQANALDGSFTSNKFHNTIAWYDLSTGLNLNYCENDGNASGKDIDKVSGSVNNLTYGTSAAADDCTASQFDSDWLFG
jgi:hypothetical protein